VNLRAPIFLDTERALAVQVVLSDPAYPFRHPLAKRSAA
jgi:flagellar assembly factor FliW